MHTIKKVIAFLIGLVFFTSSFSQCYTQLDDVSGFDRSTSFYVVEQAACRLLDSLPSDLRDSFGIYGFGFYRLVDHYGDYSYDQIFEEVIADKVTKPYYIIFGRESGKEGIYTQIKVRVNLPGCMLNEVFDQEESTLNWIRLKLEQEVRESLRNPPEEWAIAESRALYWLEDYVSEKKSCCIGSFKNSCEFCTWTTDDMIKELRANDFIEFDITITNPDPTIDYSCSCSGGHPPILLDDSKEERKSLNSGITIDHQAYKIFNFDLKGHNYNSNLESLKNDLRINGCSFSIQVNDFFDFCDGTFFTKMKDWPINPHGAIVYIVQSREWETKDKLFIKMKEFETCLDEVNPLDWIELKVPYRSLYTGNQSYDIGTIESNFNYVYSLNGFDNIQWGGDIGFVSGNPSITLFDYEGRSAGGITTFSKGGGSFSKVFLESYCREGAFGTYVCNELQHSYTIAYACAHEVLHGLIDLSWHNVVDKFLNSENIVSISYPSYTLKWSDEYPNKYASKDSEQEMFHFDEKCLNYSQQVPENLLRTQSRGAYDEMLEVHKDLLEFWFDLEYTVRGKKKNDFFIHLLSINTFMQKYDASHPNGIVH